MKVLVVILGCVLVMLTGSAVLTILLHRNLRKTASENGEWSGPFYYPNCPRCSTPVPKARVPRSLRQVFLGGWTCQSCGCEIARNGHER
ncbi:MAG: hypothetical protein DMF63_13460 [Acidobacteria bacterium]|nr:MAG: hypothetical protein DMF63_13460 [Acidobacteriota bacterium]